MTRSNILSVNVLQDIDVNRFRLECLSNNSVTCPLSTMHDNWLVNHKLSEIWWDLTDEERESVSDYIVNNYIFSVVRYFRKGKNNCQGGEDEWIKKEARCLYNALIRLALFGETMKWYDDLSSCYWSLDKVHENCYISENFNLPVYFTCIRNRTEDGRSTFTHAVCAFQIKSDTNDFNSWRFFQYTNSEIKPGGDQMPCTYDDLPVYVEIFETSFIHCSGHGGNPIVKWKLNEDCSPEIINIAKTSKKYNVNTCEDDYKLLDEKLKQLYCNPDLHIDSYIVTPDEVLLFVSELSTENLELERTLMNNRIVKLIISYS